MLKSFSQLDLPMFPSIWKLKIRAMLISFFPAGFAGQGVLNKSPTVWLDGARPANTCIPSSFLGNTPVQPRIISTPIAQSHNTFGGLAIFLSGVHQMCMVDSSAKKYVSKYIKITNLELYYVSESILRGIWDTSSLRFNEHKNMAFKFGKFSAKSANGNKNVTLRGYASSSYGAKKKSYRINRGVQYLTGENLKVLWAEFSTLS